MNLQRIMNNQGQIIQLLPLFAVLFSSMLKKGYSCQLVETGTVLLKV